MGRVVCCAKQVIFSRGGGYELTDSHGQRAGNSPFTEKGFRHDLGHDPDRINRIDICVFVYALQDKVGDKRNPFLKRNRVEFFFPDRNLPVFIVRRKEIKSGSGQLVLKFEPGETFVLPGAGGGDNNVDRTWLLLLSCCRVLVCGGFRVG